MALGENDSIVKTAGEMVQKLAKIETELPGYIKKNNVQPRWRGLPPWEANRTWPQETEII